MGVSANSMHKHSTQTHPRVEEILNCVSSKYVSVNIIHLESSVCLMVQPNKLVEFQYDILNNKSGRPKEVYEAFFSRNSGNKLSVI